MQKFKNLKGYFFIFFFSIFFIINFISPVNLNAQNLVSNRTNFYFINEDGKEVQWQNEFKGKWNIFWFFDDYCPFSVKAAPEFHLFLDYINYYYPDYINVVFVEALNRKWDSINYFRDKLGFQDYNFYLSPDMATNEYLNVDRTPTMIIMDPYGNIVDKVAGKVPAIVYARHLDLILGRYFKIKGIYDYGNPDDIINESSNKLLQKFKTAVNSMEGQGF